MIIRALCRVGIVLYVTATLSSNQLRAENALVASTMLQIGEARLELAEQILARAVEHISEEPGISAQDGHYELKKFIKNNSLFRSLLAINADGTLLFDSYNRFRFTSPNLSQRKYFADGMSSSHKLIAIHDPVFGKQSGVPFIPLSMRTHDAQPSDTNLIVMTFDPQSLLPALDWCPVCGSIVLKDGVVIAATSLLSAVNEDIASRLVFSGNYGQQKLELRGMNIDIHWRRSNEFGLIFATYEGQGSSDE